MSIPNYTGSLCVQAALQRIRDAPARKKYEHHVSTWAASMLKGVFQDQSFAMSSEVIDPHEKSKPDFLIEKVSPQKKFVKKTGGDHFEKALYQARKHIRQTLEDESDFTKECFVIVQRGMDIGFFEYHARTEDLDNYAIQHFRGCVSLTQPIFTDEDMPYSEEDLAVHGQDFDPMDKIHPDLKGHVTFNHRHERVILNQIPQDARPLSYGNYNGDIPDLVSITSDARNYTTPCVFDIEQHKEIIDYFYHYMLIQTPRKITNDS